MTIGNIAALIRFGELSVTRLDPNEFFLQFGQDFLVDAQLSVERQADVANSTCTVTTKFFASSNENDKNVRTSTVKETTTDECSAMRSSFLAGIDFEARPAVIVDDRTNTERPVGQQFRHTFHVVDGSKLGGAESSADASMRLTSFSNWLLRARTVSGAGISFDIGSDEEGSRQFITVSRKTL